MGCERIKSNLISNSFYIQSDLDRLGINTQVKNLKTCGIRSINIMADI
jgi:hypothetical protein